MTASLVVLNRQRRRRIDTKRLRDIVARAGRSLKARGEVALLVAGDGTIRRLNSRYRGKDKPTDVLSFPGPGTDGGLGDIVISVPAAERNARRLKRTLAQELDVLVLHGFLHVLGYDHETDDGAMDRLEGRLRRRLLGAGGRRRYGASSSITRPRSESSIARPTRRTPPLGENAS